MKAYAEHPDLYTRVAFNWLLDRCEQSALWDMSSRMPIKSAPEALLKLRLGVVNTPQKQDKQQLSIAGLADKTDAERQQFYMKCMEAAGVCVDSEGRTIDKK